MATFGPDPNHPMWADDPWVQYHYGNGPKPKSNAQVPQQPQDQQQQPQDPNAQPQPYGQQGNLPYGLAPSR